MTRKCPHCGKNLHDFFDDAADELNGIWFSFAKPDGILENYGIE